MPGKGKEPTKFTLEDGVYIFDAVGMEKAYSEKKKYAEKRLIDRIAEAIPCSQSTVKGWIHGDYGPADLNTVDTLAIFFGCDRKIFLKKVKERDKKMNNISDSERTVARNLYGEMLEMMYFLDWEEPDFMELYPEEKTRTPVTGRFSSVEEAREHYLLTIRKTALDLPIQMRIDLAELVNTCFGEREERHDFLACFPESSSMYFNTHEYGTFLKEKGWGDNVESRYEYEFIFKNKVSSRLDEIFKDYIRL